MADSQHIGWLLQGADRWNRRREQQDFTPDLSETDIYSEFRKARQLNGNGSIPLAGMNLARANLRGSCLSHSLQGADLTGAFLFSATLQNAKLHNSRLDGATIIGARFDNATLNRASLCRVKAGSTSFRGTSLFGADLTDAQMNNSYFAGANLSCATLKGTDLIQANITGSDLLWPRPWEAKLFQDRHSTTKRAPPPEAHHLRCGSDQGMHRTQRASDRQRDLSSGRAHQHVGPSALGDARCERPPIQSSRQVRRNAP